MVASQLQVFVDLINYPAPFQSGFRPHLGLEEALTITVPMLECGRSTSPLLKLDQWFLTLGYSGVFELQLPETPASRAGGEGFWEVQSKNT